MIEVVSGPADLTAWDGADPPFYLEVFGEARPTVDLDYAQVLRPGSEAAQAAATTPIYEYWWTIGHPGRRPEQHHLFGAHDPSIWANLDDPAAHVYLYFPVNAGWRIKELLATVKYLRPIQDQKSISEKAAEEWKVVAPALSDASTISHALTPIPGIGAVAAGAAPVLSALSKLQIGSIPQSAEGFNWYVDKVTTAGVAGRGVMQGVMWSLPKKMFECLGGRLTGSLAVSFIPSKASGDADWSLETAPIYAHAAVSAKGDQHWVPAAKNRFVELPLRPQLPSPSSAPAPASPPASSSPPPG